MRPLSALHQAVAAAIREPAVIVVAAVLALVQLPVLLARLLPPTIAVIASLGISLLTLLLAPFTQGGMLGLADSALDGDASVRTFLAAGRDNYVSMLGAYVLLTAIAIAVVIAIMLILLFGAGFGAATASIESGAVNNSLFDAFGIVFLALFGLLGISVVLGFVFIQFYGQAIVIEDYGAIGGFKRSVSLVRSHVLATLGYSVIAFVIGGVLSITSSGASALLSSERATLAGLNPESLPLLGGVALVVVVVSTLSSAFGPLYSVSFYHQLGER
jgi:hypothetical protein